MHDKNYLSRLWKTGSHVAMALLLSNVLTTAYAVVTPFSCLSHVSKQATGSRVYSNLTSYTCGGAANTGGNATITLKLGPSSGTTLCDEGSVPDGSLLSAGGQIERRPDGLTQFAGKFTITSPSNVVLYTGTIDLMDRVDAHHPSMGTESCAPLNHMEGFLDGVSPNTGCLECTTYKIHALVNTSAIPGPGSAADVLNGNVDGITESNPSF